MDGTASPRYKTADPAVSSNYGPVGQQLVWATTKRVAVDLKAEAKVF